MDMIDLSLTRDEALVLFDWLVRWNQEDSPSLDPAERRVLWDLEAALETRLPDVVANDYASRLEQARTRLREPG